MAQICSICGEKSIMGKSRLSDGNSICRKCSKLIPKDISDYALTYWDKGAVETFIEYRKYSEDVLKPLFSMSVKAGPFILDELHGLYRLSDKDLVYTVSDLKNIRFLFEPQELQKTVLRKPYATGVSKIIVEQECPPFRATVVVSTYAKAEGYMENGMFNARLPDDLLRLRTAISGCKGQIEFEKRKARKEAEQDALRQEQEKRDKANRQETPSKRKDDGVTKAMALFMLDTLNGLTETDLKRQRNKLLKAFHPDEGEESAAYSQKINNAYELLLKKVKQT